MRYNKQFKDVYDAINYLMQKKKQDILPRERKRIGFKQAEQSEPMNNPGHILSIRSREFYLREPLKPSNFFTSIKTQCKRWIPGENAHLPQQTPLFTCSSVSKSLFSEVPLIFILLFQTISANSQTQPAGPDHYESEKYFWSTLDSISAMLEGRRPLNFKSSVYQVENAFLENRLDERIFDQQIFEMTRYCRFLQNVHSHDYHESDSSEFMANAAIYSFLADTIRFASANDNFFLTPPNYDFEDPGGNREWTNMFVSKLLATGKGNCHSLPYLYKILADESGTPAWLSLAPNHVFIRSKSVRCGWYNTELTSKSFPDDSWMVASGYIHSNAMRNGMFLDTLSSKEAIALTLADLAMGFRAKYRSGDGRFILQACRLALADFPDCLPARLLEVETEVELLASRCDGNRACEPEEWDSVAKKCMEIYRDGYRPVPESLQKKWAEPGAGSRQKESGQKGESPDDSIFFPGTLTLSNGKYPEVFRGNSIVTFGRIRLNITTGEIISILPEPETFPSWHLDPAVMSRFLNGNSNVTYSLCLSPQ